MTEPPAPPSSPPRRVGWWQTVGSVLASFFGVQSNRNRERDFSQGSAARFIAIGLTMTVTFILVLYLVVRLVLRLAQ